MVQNVRYLTLESTYLQAQDYISKYEYRNFPLVDTAGIRMLIYFIALKMFLRKTVMLRLEEISTLLLMIWLFDFSIETMILLGSIHRNELERMVDKQLNMESMKALYTRRTMGKELPIPALPPHMQRTESESSCTSTASVSVTSPLQLTWICRQLPFALCF